VEGYRHRSLQCPDSLGCEHVVQGIQVPPRTLGQITITWVTKPIDIGLMGVRFGRTWVGHCPSPRAAGPNFSRTGACPLGGLTPIGKPAMPASSEPLAPGGWARNAVLPHPPRPCGHIPIRRTPSHGLDRGHKHRDSGKGIERRLDGPRPFSGEPDRSGSDSLCDVLPQGSFQYLADRVCRHLVENQQAFWQLVF